MPGDAILPAPVPIAGGTGGSALARQPDLVLLDEPEEWQGFSRERATDAGGSSGHWESTVALEGMHCAACARTVERLLRSVAGVLEVEVSVAAQRARVLWDERRVRPSQWVGALEGTGYRAVPAHDVAAGQRRQAETRHMLWRLGVAGLCMMQVMMYAAPVYFSAPGEIAPDLVQLLRWAQWVLSVPVVLFSCQPFFRGAWRDLRLRQVSMDLPVALGMAITFVVSSWGTFQPAGVFGREVYFDSLTMFVFFLLTGRWLELRVRNRTAGALAALLQRMPQSVLCLQADGRWERVAVRRVRVGDRLRVLAGEAFAADGTVTHGSTTVDEALLTGESHPLARGVGDGVVAGSHNLTAPVEVLVREVGDGTRFAQIVALMEQAATGKPRIAQLADRLAKPFLLMVLLAAALAAAWWWPRDPAQALMVAVAILVVTCPCALSLATPAAMLASAGALARRGVLVRRLQAIETLAGIDTIVFDKTGTLTRDAFVLASVRTRAGVAPGQALAWAAALARQSLHPLSRALAIAADAAAEVARLAARDVCEQAGAGLQGCVDVAGNWRQLRLGSAAFCEVEPGSSEGPAVHLADAAGWLARFDFQEDLRADAQAAVAALHGQQVRLALLSGDRPQAAARVGALIGIDEARGGCSPADKLAWLKAAHGRGARVAMVGDGLNDGPILAGAAVSFAFGQAVPLAQSTSDFVVLGERLQVIPQVRRQALRTMRVVRQNLGWALVYNAVGIPLAAMGWMPAWAAGLGMAASSLLVVLNAVRLTTAPDPGGS